MDIAKRLIVNHKSILLESATNDEIRDHLRTIRAASFTTCVRLPHDPNRFGTDCMVSGSEIRSLLRNVVLCNEPGRGARIIESCLHINSFVDPFGRWIENCR